ncbi:MAG: sigma-54-dependent transcriptional regulator [Saccharospirillum sp.]
MNDALQAIVIDDDPAVLESLEQWLSLARIDVLCFQSAQEALPHLNEQYPGVVVSDIRMPGLDGMSLLRQMDPAIPVILITGHGGIAQAVEAMKIGAFDFLEKPYKPERLVETIKRACQQRQVTLATAPVPEAHNDALAESLLGQSPQIENVRKQIRALARANADIIITGETGTGKELVARNLHALSVREAAPFVAINVAAIPENLLESELFGHEAGAFTGAQKRQEGYFEAANNGTLFLDEIESMSMEFQIKLLRVLQEREVTRVGSRTPIPINVRILSASKENLRDSATAGRFREDLYYRLMVAEIQLPPLRDRKGDVPVLFQYFLRQASAANQLPAPELSYDDLLALELHDWPGNVRELRHTAERWLLTNSFQQVSVSELLQLGSTQRLALGGPEASLSARMEQVEKALISAELKQHRGEIKPVLEALDLPRRTLNQKMQKYGLKREDFLLI